MLYIPKISISGNYPDLVLSERANLETGSIFDVVLCYVCFAVARLILLGHMATSQYMLLS